MQWFAMLSHTSGTSFHISTVATRVWNLHVLPVQLLFFFPGSNPYGPKRAKLPVDVNDVFMCGLRWFDTRTWVVSLPLVCSFQDRLWTSI